MKKRFYISLAWKVILASIVTMATIFIIHTAIIQAFEEITENIDRLARPNERLLAVNRLLREVSHLNHSQQEELASRRRNPSLSFVNESKAIYQTIDTLHILFRDDSVQSRRFYDINEILLQREKLFVEYLELQYIANENPDLREYISNISKTISNEDDVSKVVKVFETTTSTTVSSDTLLEQSSSFLERLFGKKQIPRVPGVVRSETHVNKEYRVVVDTIEVKRNNALMVLLENSMDSLQTRQLQQLARIQRQELELFNTNSRLIQEINQIINTVEKEEIAHQSQETRSAFEIAGQTIKNLNYLAIAFITLSVILVLLIIIDISKSNRYRRRLEQANNEARLEAQAKQRFLSNMSHEIRTPLQSIYGYTELARLQPDMKVDIETIYHSAGHLLDVVNEVLDYARVTSGQISLEKIRFDPKAEITSVVTAMQPLAMKKGLKLILDDQLNRSLNLRGDPFRLRQILFNLTGNSIKFTNEGEVRVIVSLDNSDHTSLKIVVIDSGVGIPEKQLPYLFKEYTHSNSLANGNDNGTGLGLSIVKKLIEIQNGKIEVESSPSAGSRFSVTIPYEIAPEKEKQVKKVITNGKGIPAFTKTVLLADDDPTILNLSSAILKKYNIPNRTFTNGPDLLQAFYENPDVFIFLDVHMPEMNGMEVCKQIRKHSRHNNHIKVFALTAQALPDERQIILNAGFDGMVIKPFKESDILEVLGKVAGNTNGEVSSPVNLELLVKMTGNDKHQLKMILNTMIRESRNDLGELKQSLDNSRYDKLALLVHRMAGRVGQAGADQYAMALRNLEVEIKNGIDTEKLEKHVNKALKDGDFFIREIKGYINGIIAVKPSL